MKLSQLRQLVDAMQEVFGMDVDPEVTFWVTSEGLDHIKTSKTPFPDLDIDELNPKLHRECHKQKFAISLVPATNE